MIADVENAKWILKAGDMYLSDFRYKEAIQSYMKVLDMMKGLHHEDADLLYIDAAIKYSKISTAGNDIKTVLSFLKEAMARAKKLRNEKSQAILLMNMAKNEWLSSRYRKAMSYFEAGWAMAKGMDDPDLYRSATAFSTFFLYWQGRFKEAVESYEKIVPDIEKYPKGRFPLLAAITLGQCYAFTGNVSQALGMIEAINSRCLERGDLNISANAEGTIASIMLEIHRIEEAVRYLESALEKAYLKHNYLVQILGKISLAYAYYLLDKNDRSLNYLKEFLDQSRKVRMRVQLYPYLMELCWAMKEGRFPEVDGIPIEHEIYRTLKGDNVFLKGVAFRYRALLQKKEGQNYGKIINSLKTSMRWLQISGHQTEYAKTQFELARIYLEMDKEEEAKRLMMEAWEMLFPFGEDLIPDDLLFLIEKPNFNDRLLKEILKLGQEIVAIRESESLGQRIISAVNRLTGAERGAIFLIDESTNPPSLELKASKNITLQDVWHKDFSSSMNMIRAVTAEGKGCILGGDSEGGGNSLPIRSRICVPMILRGKVMGVIYQDNRLLTSSFKESDLELLGYFAGQAAFALQNMKDYMEIQRLNMKLSEEKQYYEEKHLESLHFEDIIGESPAISHVLSQVNKVAPTDTTILILGETGVGKELLASAIHQRSLRHKGPFIRVNCSSLPESLIPSELFGHEKGAFTGAIQRRTGRFELANGGTLFIDEIGDIPLDIQIRLLRVLESKEFERVGGNETLYSDFRLIVATNRDLKQMVRSGEFREDLYYRINVFPILIPPLRERKEDIPLLAHYFLKIYSRKMRKKLDGIPPKEMEKLIQYDWPGNVRELENVIERGVILSEGSFKVPELDSGNEEPFRTGNHYLTLKENERISIIRALKKTGWKVRGPGGAAELLDINPSTLFFRMKKLGIQKPKGLANSRHY